MSHILQPPRLPLRSPLRTIPEIPQLSLRSPLLQVPRAHRTARNMRRDEEQEIEAEEDIARLQETTIDVDALVHESRTGYPYGPLLNIDTLIMRPPAAVRATSAHGQAYELRGLRPSSLRSSLASGRTLQVHPGTSSQSSSPSIYSSASEPSDLNLAYPPPTADSSIHRGLTHIPASRSNTSFEIYDEDEDEFVYGIANDNEIENDPPPPYTSNLPPAPPYTPRDRRHFHAARRYNKKHRRRSYKALLIPTSKCKKQLKSLGVYFAMAALLVIPLGACLYFALRKIPVRYSSGAVLWL